MALTYVKQNPYDTNNFAIQHVKVTFLNNQIRHIKDTNQRVNFHMKQNIKLLPHLHK